MLKYLRPRPDITAYEVAFLFAHCVPGPVEPMWKSGVHFTGEQWANEVPDEMKRHWSDAP